MSALSPQLTRLPVQLRGEWIRRWNRNLWGGTLSCREQFVILLVIRCETELMWAKSKPSTDNTLELKLDLLPISTTDPRFQLIFSSGSGAFIQGATVELPEPEYRPTIKIPKTFETGTVVPFTRFVAVERLDFSLVCIAKTDVVVRRRYVWGLKPRFLGDLHTPWKEILARGRNGVASLTVTT